MGLKLLVILLIIGIQASNGGKILKKLSKELKKVIGGAKFEDFIKDNIAELAGISDDVAENADKIHLVADNINIVGDYLYDNITSNSEKIHVVADHVDSSIVSISEDVANLKVDVANNLANITKNAMDIASHHSSDCDPNEHVNAILEYGESETVPDWTVNCYRRGKPGTALSDLPLCVNWWCFSNPGYISTQLIGNGRGKLNYGLCGGGGSSSTSAKVTVYLNGNEISSTFGGSVLEASKDVEFDYNDSDILKIEEIYSVFQFNSFSVVGCGPKSCSYDNDPNYHLIGNLCVYFEAQKMTASSAKTNCAGKFGNDHGRLFEPKSLGMYQSVYDSTNALGHPSGGSWIGVDDLNSEGNYVYSSNGQGLPFTIPWHSGEPHGSSSDCIVIGHDNDYEWKDATCSYQTASICERV